MFFIYLFFSIGILATLLAILPTMVEIVVYLHSIFANVKTAKDNKAEVKKALLDKKKELKLAKIKGETENKEEVIEVEPVEEVVEEQQNIEVKVEEEKEEPAPVTEPAIEQTPSVEPNVPTDEQSIPTPPAE